jgi:nucleoside-diphosphate-sugar epimerase
MRWIRRVVPNFIRQALVESPDVYDDVSRTRSFCYVSDLDDGCTGCSTTEESKRSTSATPRR